MLGRILEDCETERSLIYGQKYPIRETSVPFEEDRLCQSEEIVIKLGELSLAARLIYVQNINDGPSHAVFAAVLSGRYGLSEEETGMVCGCYRPQEHSLGCATVLVVAEDEKITITDQCPPNGASNFMVISHESYREGQYRVTQVIHSPELEDPFPASAYTRKLNSYELGGWKSKRDRLSAGVVIIP